MGNPTILAVIWYCYNNVTDQVLFILTWQLRGMSNTWPPCFLAFCKLHFGILYRGFSLLLLHKMDILCFLGNSNHVLHFELFQLLSKFQTGFTFCAFSVFCHTGKVKGPAFSAFSAFFWNSNLVLHFALFPPFAILASNQEYCIFCL